MELVQQNNNQLQLTQFYDSLDGDTANYLKAKEYEIVQIGNSYLTDLGKIFKEAQDRLSNNKNGTFVKWIEALGIQEKQVFRWINRYDYILTNCQYINTIESLPKSLSYEISKKSAPADLVQSVLDGDIATNKNYIELQKQLTDKTETERLQLIRLNALKQTADKLEREKFDIQKQLEQKEKDLRQAKADTTTIFQDVIVDNPKLISEINELKSKLANDNSKDLLRTIRDLENDIRIKNETIEKELKNVTFFRQKAEQVERVIDNNCKGETEKFRIVLKDFINSQIKIATNTEIENFKKQIFNILG